MDPKPCGYDIILRNDERWFGQRELDKSTALKFLDALKCHSKAWWLIQVRTNKILDAGGEGKGHHPKEYGYDRYKGLASLFYRN